MKTNIDITNQMLGIEDSPKYVRISKDEEVEVFSDSVPEYCMIGVKRNGKTKFWCVRSEWLNILQPA